MQLMRRVMLVALMFAQPVAAQALSGEPFLAAFSARPKGGSSPSAPEDGKTYPLLVLTPTLPVGFNELTLSQAGPQLGQKLSLGVGGTLILGAGTYSTAGGSPKLNLQPYAFVGAALDFGVANSTGALGSTFTASGFIGLGPVALSIGRDFLRSVTVIGLATKIDIMTFVPGGYLAFPLGNSGW